MVKLLSIFFLFGIFLNGCSGDDNGSEEPNPPTGMEDDDPAPTELESGWVVAYRNETPQGRVYFMEVNEEIPAESNVSEAVELGLNARIYSFGDNPITWNGDAGTLTKWNVDRTNLELSIGGIISFASNGITGNRGEPVFISETEAYMENLLEGVIVEWNPTTMEITRVVNVDTPPEITGGTGAYFVTLFSNVTSDGKIVYGVDYRLPACCEYVGPEAAVIAVFDPSQGTLEYQQDDRLLSANNIVRDEQGHVYITPSNLNAFTKEYFNDAENLPSPYTLLRVGSDGELDSDYSLDLSSLLPIEVANGFSFITNNRIVISYVDSNENQLPESFDARFGIFGAPSIPVAIDVETGEVFQFDAFSNFNYSGFPSRTDGSLFLVAGQFFPNGDPERSTLQREDGFNNFTEVFAHTGGTVQHIARLW
ncbi:MAG: hypothetical protein AAFP96_00435 [Bacteroidota bacterium]